MATGTVTSFNNNSTDPTIVYFGTVTVDETGEIIDVVDPGFNSSNFSIGGACSFAISSDEDSEGNYTASGVKPGVPAGNNQTITAPYKGDLTANVGDVITISSAAAIVNGNITINGGKVIVDQSAQINGAINVTADGIMVARNKGQVTGTVVINSGGSMKVVNNGQVNGTVTASQAGRLMVGNANGPGAVIGAVDIQKIRGVDITAGSTLGAGGLLNKIV